MPHMVPSQLHRAHRRLVSDHQSARSSFPLCCEFIDYVRKKSPKPLSLKDQIFRERWLILWGSIPNGTDPSTTAQKVITSVCDYIKGNCVAAQWLRAKRSKSKKGIVVSLPSCNHVAEVVSKRLLILGEILRHPQRVVGLSEKPACKTAVFRTPDPTTER